MRVQPSSEVCAIAVGIVVIGRNEGERLKRCLESMVGRGAAVVYVDSGSTDGSVAFARSLGIEVIELDTAAPFTAARARNAGFEKVLQANSALEFVQFIDGDCEMADGWLGLGLAGFRGRADVAVVCGRLRERYPEASIYNRLCDIEWNLPVGKITGCGGVMMMRVSAFRQVGGFDPAVIAAEDTELCARLRSHGWRIVHIAAEMASHDAAILHASQWWRRCVRAGYGFAQFSGSDGREGRDFFRKQLRSAWLWGVILPILVLLTTWFTSGLGLSVLVAYPILAIRIYLRERKKQVARVDAIAYALHCTLAKFPQAIGTLKYKTDLRYRRPGTIIEHKRPAG